MERHLIVDKDRLQLIKELQSVVGIPLPTRDIYLGNIQFFLREHDNKKQFDFQIRWGAKNIFVDRNIVCTDQNAGPGDFIKIFKNNSTIIRKKIIEYSIEQLNNIIAIELPMQIQNDLPSFFDYNIFVNVYRKQKKEKTSNEPAYPPISVFISWDDELGEFQEFVYPLQFDADTAHFKLDYPAIVEALRIYRDSI